MKTKTRILIAVCVLGFTGINSINAIADDKKSVNTDVVSINKEISGNQSMSADQDFFNAAEELTAREAELQIEKYANRQILLQGNAISKPDLTSAESYTKSSADQEIEKYVSKQLSLINARNDK